MVSMTGHHVLNNEVIRGSNFDEVRNTCNPYSDALLMTTDKVIRHLLGVDKTPRWQISSWQCGCLRKCSLHVHISILNFYWASPLALETVALFKTALQLLVFSANRWAGSASDRGDGCLQSLPLHLWFGATFQPLEQVPNLQTQHAQKSTTSTQRHEKIYT